MLSCYVSPVILANRCALTYGSCSPTHKDCHRSRAPQVLALVAFLCGLKVLLEWLTCPDCAHEDRVAQRRIQYPGLDICLREFAKQCARSVKPSSRHFEAARLSVGALGLEDLYCHDALKIVRYPKFSKHERIIPHGLLCCA